MIGVLLLDTLALVGAFGSGVLVRPWMKSKKTDLSSANGEAIIHHSNEFHCPYCDFHYGGTTKYCECPDIPVGHFHITCKPVGQPAKGCHAKFVMLAKNAKL
jgi:hypothetical protein